MGTQDLVAGLERLLLIMQNSGLGMHGEIALRWMLKNMLGDYSILYMWSTAEWSWCVHLWELQYREWHLKFKCLQTLSCLTLTTHCCVMTTVYCDVILDVCWKWAMLPARPPRIWRIFLIAGGIPDLRHGGFGTPRAFPRQLIGCGRVTWDL